VSNGQFESSFTSGRGGEETDGWSGKELLLTVLRFSEEPGRKSVTAQEPCLSFGTSGKKGDEFDDAPAFDRRYENRGGTHRPVGSGLSKKVYATMQSAWGLPTIPTEEKRNRCSEELSHSAKQKKKSKSQAEEE